MAKTVGFFSSYFFLFFFAWIVCGRGFPGGLLVKSPPTVQGMPSLIPVSGRAPGEGDAAHSIILAWEIPWAEEPGGLPIHGVAKELDTI